MDELFPSELSRTMIEDDKRIPTTSIPGSDYRSHNAVGYNR